MNKIHPHKYRPFCMLLIGACFSVFIVLPCYAQKYAFSHYDVENGLIQSQANKLCQDSAHRLWIATLGGMCRFDGKEYYPISKANGLPDNYVTALYADKKGLIWFGTNGGLQYLQNKKIINCPVPKGFEKRYVTSIAEDGKGTIWVILGRTLFRIENRRFVMVTPTGKPSLYNVSAMAVNEAGQLFVSVYNQGIYYLNGGGWIKHIPFATCPRPLFVQKIVFDKVDKHKIFLLSPGGIKVVVGHDIDELREPALKQIKEICLSLEEDGDGNLWVGTTNGAYSLMVHKLTHYTAHNGFTSASVADILNDKDNNLWLATSGNGVFKYERNNYVTYDQSNGLKNSPVVMTIARDPFNDVILGTDGGDLVKFKNGILSPLPVPSNFARSAMIGCLYTDRKKNMWIGTEYNGVWKYDGHTITPVKSAQGTSAHDIVEDANGVLWFACQRACKYTEADTLKRVIGIDDFVASLCIVGKDSVLAGTMRGVDLVVNKKLVTGFNKLKVLNGSAIYCMLQIKDDVLFGTDDRGLFIWNKHTGEIKNYNVKDGLKSYLIYSLLRDKNGTLWIGTGRGVNRAFFNAETMACTIFGDGNATAPIVETNQNAIMADGDKILVGTAKGLKVYDAAVRPVVPTAPHIIIQNVKVFSHDDAQSQDITGTKSKSINLSAGQNHLSINFLGIYLKNPESVWYQYKLTGLDNKFCQPVKNNMVDYPSLPPGKYTFEVKALTDNGFSSRNTARFSFEIIPPFYKTIPFQIAVVLFFVLMGIALQNFIHRRKIRERLTIEAMKREEKAKIRQQTAEDFHDDIGNKLTRITVLTEILNTKIDAGKTDQRNIVEQIRQNVAALYNGTKDVLWALDPKSDNLYEMLMHLKEVGNTLFQDTEVDFTFLDIDDSFKNIKLSMEYSRNITMIFKETLNNTLKHAGAGKVIMDVKPVENNQILMSMRDNGAGFDMDKMGRGHGIFNIKSRANRINSELGIFSKPGMGTVVELKFSKN